MHISQIKEQIAKFAVEFIENGMVIGLGTGTTAASFIQQLAKEKLKITCVATSLASETLARSLGLQCVSIDQIDKIDITFDGADEIDAQKRVIKGAGGALLREKIVAFASHELVMLVDEKKIVANLGAGKLPVEVTPFGHLLTARHIEALGFSAEIRKGADGAPFITDNHNFIYDIYFKEVLKNPEEVERQIHAIPGVVTTGFFFNLVGRVIIGKSDGSIELRQ